MTEYEIEAIPGLPGPLPAGERILWQGKPDRAVLARTAFHTRMVSIYFALLTAVAFASALPRLGDGAPALLGTVATATCGLLAVGVLNLLAWATARGTIYTLTNRRIVLRIGVAVPKCINLPLKLVTAVDLRTHADASGDISMRLIGTAGIGYAAIWPHARPGRIARPEPMLRAIPGAADVADHIARCVRALGQEGIVAAARTAPVPVEAAA